MQLTIAVHYQLPQTVKCQQLCEIPGIKSLIRIRWLKIGYAPVEHSCIEACPSTCMELNFEQFRTSRVIVLPVSVFTKICMFG